MNNITFANNATATRNFSFNRNSAEAIRSVSSARIQRFGKGGAILRSNQPLSNDQIIAAAPSVFAEAKHDSRSARYSYIPTSHVLENLRKEGFQPWTLAEELRKIKAQG